MKKFKEYKEEKLEMDKIQLTNKNRELKEKLM